MVLSNVIKFLKNKNSKLVISLLIALYAGGIAPMLPNNVILFFDTVIGKLLFVFLIAYVASRDVQVAVMLALAFVVTLTVINQRRTEQFSLEGFDTCTGEAVEESAVTNETDCKTGCLNSCDNLRQCVRHKYVYIAKMDDGKEQLEQKVTSITAELESLKTSRNDMKTAHDEKRENNQAPSSVDLRELAEIRDNITNKKYHLELLETIRINKKWTWNQTEADSADPFVGSQEEIKETFTDNDDEDGDHTTVTVVEQFVPLPADNLSGDASKFHSPF